MNNFVKNDLLLTTIEMAVELLEIEITDVAEDLNWFENNYNEFDEVYAYLGYSYDLEHTLNHLNINGKSDLMVFYYNYINELYNNF